MDTSKDVTVRLELYQIDFAREYERTPLYVTEKVWDIINEEPKWTNHRRQVIAAAFTTTRNWDFCSHRPSIWQPIFMANHRGGHIVDFRFCVGKMYGEDTYLITLASEDLPDGFELSFHPDA